MRVSTIIRGLIPSLSFSDSHYNIKISLMIDTGLQGNIVKISSVPQSVEIDDSLIKTLRGISNGVVRTMDMIRFSIFRCSTELQVVEDEFQVPFDGVLGSEYLFQNKCKLDFGSKTLTVNRTTCIRFDQGMGISGEKKIVNISEGDKLPFVDIFYNSDSGEIAQFLIDTGAE